jgi:ribosomal subunit interface protein
MEPKQPPFGRRAVQERRKTDEIRLTDKKIDLPEKVYAYAEKKIGKLDRFFKADAQADVTFSVEREKNVVELTVRSGSLFSGRGEKTFDMFNSIDAAVSTIERRSGATRPAGKAPASERFEQDGSNFAARRLKSAIIRWYGPNASPSSP